MACDLAADGGDMRDRIGMWQQVFAHVQGRDPLADTETGVALRFPLDADLAATLARLAAAEYRYRPANRDRALLLVFTDGRRGGGACCRSLRVVSVAGCT